jgi:queuine tRNA-ribosyltransferase
MLMTEHNLCFYQALMADLREAIASGGLAAFAAEFRMCYGSGEGPRPG